MKFTNHPIKSVPFQRFHNTSQGIYNHLRQLDSNEEYEARLSAPKSVIDAHPCNPDGTGEAGKDWLIQTNLDTVPWNRRMRAVEHGRFGGTDYHFALIDGGNYPDGTAWQRPGVWRTSNSGEYWSFNSQDLSAYDPDRYTSGNNTFQLLELYVSPHSGLVVATGTDGMIIRLDDIQGFGSPSVPMMSDIDGQIPGTYFGWRSAQLGQLAHSGTAWILLSDTSPSGVFRNPTSNLATDNWSLVLPDPDLDFSFISVEYGDGKFVVFSRPLYDYSTKKYETRMYVSTDDGLNWTESRPTVFGNLDPNGGIRKVKYNEDLDLWVAAGYDYASSTYYPKIFTSKDGINWSQSSVTGNGARIDDLEYGDGFWVGCGYGNSNPGRFWYSTDETAKSWYYKDVEPNLALNGIGYNPADDTWLMGTWNTSKYYRSEGFPLYQGCLLDSDVALKVGSKARSVGNFDGVELFIYDDPASNTFEELFGGTRDLVGITPFVDYAAAGEWEYDGNDYENVGFLTDGAGTFTDVTYAFNDREEIEYGDWYPDLPSDFSDQYAATANSNAYLYSGSNYEIRYLVDMYGRDEGGTEIRERFSTTTFFRLNNSTPNQGSFLLGNTDGTRILSVEVERVQNGAIPVGGIFVPAYSWRVSSVDCRGDLSGEDVSDWPQLEGTILRVYFPTTYSSDQSTLDEWYRGMGVTISSTDKTYTYFREFDYVNIVGADSNWEVGDNLTARMTFYNEFGSLDYIEKDMPVTNVRYEYTELPPTLMTVDSSGDLWEMNENELTEYSRRISAHQQTNTGDQGSGYEYRDRASIGFGGFRLMTTDSAEVYWGRAYWDIHLRDIVTDAYDVNHSIVRAKVDNDRQGGTRSELYNSTYELVGPDPYTNPVSGPEGTDDAMPGIKKNNVNYPDIYKKMQYMTNAQDGIGDYLVVKQPQTPNGLGLSGVWEERGSVVTNVNPIGEEIFTLWCRSQLDGQVV